MNIDIRPDLLAGRDPETEDADRDRTALRLCQARVSDPGREPGPRTVLGPELEYERRLLAGETQPSAGIVYDGNELQRIGYGGLPRDGRALEAVNIWFTERLFGTWDEGGRSFHLRAAVFGQPAIVSGAGLVRAPAREREYYIARRLGVSDEELELLPGDHLRPGDARIAEAAKGYAMQAVFYAAAGWPFCDDPRCRLYNAHWQRELLAAQLEGPDYCPRHKQMLRDWLEGPCREC